MHFAKQIAQIRHIITTYSVKLYISLDQCDLPDRTENVVCKNRVFNT